MTRRETAGILAGIGAAALLASTATAHAQPKPQVEFELMTWPEVKAALASGKTTALIYTGGTEQRGPQAVNGGHTLMAKATVKAIAEKLGTAIAMPVLPFTPNTASAQLPGTIGLTNELLASMLDRIADQAVSTGFKNVILMGDHGNGQPEVYRAAAQRLNAKYASRGAHGYYCDDVYTRANRDVDAWLTKNGFATGSHAGIADTSEMLYLGGDAWVRKDQLLQATGRSSTSGNGVDGDARKASAEIGKLVFDTKVDDAVRQIQGFVGNRQ
ncbi:MAG TPA: creatininase family protein [Vicinamibacterales bacterium]|jgi:creatinine amidohydrolase/Fe(II)-dependent formamide hydrolase-like protein|nr:creatininase family protein [Vicinamibacterales bacterium]